MADMAIRGSSIASAPVPPVLAVHGGAGPVRAGDQGREEEGAHHPGVAPERGWACLGDGADLACAAAVAYLEDCPLFNAGTGSSLAADGVVRCDAAVMRGDGTGAGVACLEGIRHPV